MFDSDACYAKLLTKCRATAMLAMPSAVRQRCLLCQVPCDSDACYAKCRVTVGVQTAEQQR